MLLRQGPFAMLHAPVWRDPPHCSIREYHVLGAVSVVPLHLPTGEVEHFQSTSVAALPRCNLQCSNSGSGNCGVGLQYQARAFSVAVITAAAAAAVITAAAVTAAAVHHSVG